MTPPNHYTNGTRRVEFSGLSTIDSEAPEEIQTHAWDSETDHLLSYFLSDPSNVGHSTPSHSQFQEYSSGRSHSNDTSPPTGMNASYGPDSSRTSSNSTLTEAAEPPQPRTPAIQFYHGSHSSSHSHSSNYARKTAENIASMQNQSQLISSSSSSSSLSSMAAALVSGGSVLHHSVHHMHHPHNTTAQQRHGNVGDSTGKGSIHPNGDSSPGHGDDSPISPAAMIGTGHENLMLPPPSRRLSRDRVQAQAAASAAGTAKPQIATSQGASASQPPFPNAQTHIVYQDPSQKEGHLEWLKQLNARAKAANHGAQPTPGQAGSMMHPPGAMVGIQHPQPPPVISQHPAGIPMPPTGAPHVFHAGTFPNAAAAAAAVAQNPMLYQAALNHKFHLAAQSQGESEEKRARRLERNRESARKSRRRKKERLATLGAQVERLHTQIEDERRNQVNAMCAALKQVRRDEIAKLVNDVRANPDQLNTQAGSARLTDILASSSAGSVIAQKSMAFQYSQLRQLLLPRYQKFMLWLTHHHDSFYTAGKDEYTRKDGKQVLRVSSGRVSSKQIGDELTNGWKTEKTDGKKSKAETPDIGERSNPTARCLDAGRMWPLLCFELSISVDQEERMLQAIKRLQQMENLSTYKSQLAAAMKLTTNLTEAIGTQCQASFAREQMSFLNVLTPAQAVKYHEWVAANQERVNRVLRERRPTPEKSYPVFKDSALEEFCKRLEEVLRISKKEHDGIGQA